MRRLLILASLILAGCGGGGGSSTAKPVVAPTPFADIAGHYTGTITFETGSPYGANSLGEEYILVISADGTVTTSQVGGTALAVYHLHRQADGSFTTDGRPLSGGLTEFGSAPADLSTCTLRSLMLWAGFTDQGTLYGSENLALVKSVGG